MDVLAERVCGLDVHQLTVVACILVAGDSQRTRVERREFSAMTDGLHELRSWLSEHGVTHVAMEGTGSYWVPVYAALEESSSLDLWLVNAHHIKQVPGRKTDWNDARWIAQLLQWGLLRKSFVPPAEFRALRDLTRARRSLVQDRTRQLNRLQKVLVTANVKLSAVISDIVGVSGLKMVHALLEGTKTPQQIAQLAQGPMRKKIPTLVRALDAKLLEHHKMLLRVVLSLLESLDEQIAKLDDEIVRRFAPHQEQLDLLDTIPGVDQQGARDILSEIGVDMTRFREPGNLAAWAGVLPGNSLSAGKRLGAGRRTGNTHLTTTLVELAYGASRTKGTYLREKFHRLRARRGGKRAAIAIANKIICAVHRMLSARVRYAELGHAYLDTRDREQTANRLIQRLRRMGLQVSVSDETATAAPS